MRFMIYPVLKIAFDEKKLDDLCVELGIEELYVFGSFARGTNTDTSDLDIMYTMKPGHVLGLEMVTLKEGLETIFGLDVDIVSMKFVNRDRHYAMLRDAKRLYEAA